MESDVVIISDYNKGYVSGQMIRDISKIASLSILDTKKKLSWDIIENISFVKQNEIEYNNTEEEKGIEKKDISREEFLAHAFEWKEKYGGIILDQLKKLGASCDWDRTRFTMEPSLYQAVIDTFVLLYNKGLIYRGVRMVNWDPAGKTAVSDEEVIHKDVQAKLYHIQYPFVDG